MDVYADGVYRFVLKHIKDKDAARDIVQDSFEKMWRKVDGIDRSKSKTYLQRLTILWWTIPEKIPEALLLTKQNLINTVILNNTPI